MLLKNNLYIFITYNVFMSMVLVNSEFSKTRTKCLKTNKNVMSRNELGSPIRNTIHQYKRFNIIRYD